MGVKVAAAVVKRAVISSGVMVSVRSAKWLGLGVGLPGPNLNLWVGIGLLVGLTLTCG